MLKGRRELEREVVTAQQALRRFGVTPIAFRPPVGITNPHLWRILLRQGMHCVNFSCRAFDRGNRAISGLADRILAKVKAGKILLLHDVKPPAGDVDALFEEFRQLLEGLQRKRLAVVPLERLTGREVMRRDDPLERPNPAATFYNDLAAGYDHETVPLRRLPCRARKSWICLPPASPRWFPPADGCWKSAPEPVFSPWSWPAAAGRYWPRIFPATCWPFWNGRRPKPGSPPSGPLLADVENCNLEGTFSAVCAFSSLAYIADLRRCCDGWPAHMEPGAALYATTARTSLFRFSCRSAT